MFSNVMTSSIACSVMTTNYRKHSFQNESDYDWHAHGMASADWRYIEDALCDAESIL